MSKLSWTIEQEAAINFSEAANLLLSAAAGSGKTTVLSERIITRAITGDVDLSRVLVMTFTDLAAKQMRNKIEARLIKARTEASAAESEHLDSLLRIFPQTQISTIHSFCNRLLGEYLAEFKGEDGQPLLEPGYSLIDEESADSLLDEVLDEVLFQHYALLDAMRQDRLDPEWAEQYQETIDVLHPESDPLEYLRDFERLSNAYAPGLSDDMLRRALKFILKKLRSLPDYRNLVRQAMEAFVAEVENFPSEDLLERSFSIFFSSFKKAKAALYALQLNSHYDRLENASSEGKRIQEQADLMDAAKNLIAELGSISEPTPENFDRIVSAGRWLDGMSMPARVGGKSVKVANHNDFVEVMSSDIMPLFYLINDNNKISKPKQEEYFPDLEPIFIVSIEQMQKDLEISIGPVARFFELILAIDKEFQREKFARNAVEFSDFEHGSFQLLQQEEICREVQNRYDEIYIDEYQDTSSIQDRIISAISRDNIFMVGDVKQSIYRFRYANPRLFQKRADKATLLSATTASDDKDYLLNLSTNFRSKIKIIDFVNEIFSSFLTREAAEIEYDQDHELNPRPGSSEPGKVSWLLLTQSGEDPSDSDNAAARDASRPASDDAHLSRLTLNPRNEMERLALLAADKINSLQDRGAQLKDIALLACTNAQCKLLRDSLELLGIPVTGTFGGIYPENLIVRQFEALLNVLDNPRQDVPLATYLASALSGNPVTPEEFIRIRPLAELALSSEKKPRLRYFHERVMLIEKLGSLENAADETIRLKIVHSMKQIRRWRLLARERNNRDLLSLVLQETQFEKLLEQNDSTRRGINTSRRRLNELQQFLDFVNRSSFQGFDSVQKLLRRLENLRQRDIFPDDSELQSDLDAVRVLTYHRSKGLEWPYVILLGLNNNQVQGDNELIALDEHDGIRSFSISADGFSVADNFLNREKMRREEERERSEAWRRLYVGMTRAKDELYLMSEAKTVVAENSFMKKNAEHILSAMPQKRETGEPILPTELVQKCNSYADILWSVLLLKYPQEISKFTAQENAHCVLPQIDLESIPYPEVLEQFTTKPDSAEKSAAVHEDMLLLSDSAFDSDAATGDVEKLVSLLSDAVPNKAAAEAPSKLTVTELKRAADRESLLLENEQLEEREAVQSFENWTVQKEKAKGGQPEEIALTLRSIDDEGKSTAAIRGTHLHSFLRFLDLSPFVNVAGDELEQELERQLAQMIKKQQLAQEAEATVRAQYPRILHYVRSPLAQRVLAAERSGRVYREMPFTLAVPAAQFGSEFPTEELTLVQGMIDLWFVEADDQVVLLDFKSDRLPSEPEEQDALMWERYGLQISFYAQAIERATGRTVKEKLIWMLSADRSVYF